MLVARKRGQVVSYLRLVYSMIFLPLSLRGVVVNLGDQIGCSLASRLHN